MKKKIFQCSLCLHEISIQLVKLSFCSLLLWIMIVLVHTQWCCSRSLALVLNQPAHSPAGRCDGRGSDRQGQSGAAGDLLSRGQTNVPGRQCLFHVFCRLATAVRVMLYCWSVCLVSILQTSAAWICQTWWSPLALMPGTRHSYRVGISLGLATPHLPDLFRLDHS